MVPSEKNVMLATFLNCDGVILTAYLLHGRAINSKYYQKFLKKLSEEMKHKWQIMLSRGTRLLHSKQMSKEAHLLHAAQFHLLCPAVWV